MNEFLIRYVRRKYDTLIPERRVFSWPAGATVAQGRMPGRFLQSHQGHALRFLLSEDAPRLFRSHTLRVRGLRQSFFQLRGELGPAHIAKIRTHIRRFDPLRLPLHHACTTTNYSSTLMIQPASLHSFVSTHTPFDSTNTRSTASCTAQRDRKTVPTSVFFRWIFTQHPPPLPMHNKSSYGSEHVRASLSPHRLPQFSRGIQRACPTLTEDTRPYLRQSHTTPCVHQQRRDRDN